MNMQTMCMGCMDSDSGLPVCPTCGRPFDLPPRDPRQLKPRTVLHDQYLIGRALGDGGFGITYLSWDLSLEMRLAIKEYLPVGAAKRSGETQVVPCTGETAPEFEWGLERFLEEARVLKKLSSIPGIVSVDTVFRQNGTAYLVMEFLDGETFEEFLARRGGTITVETALRVVLPAMDALSSLHAERSLHHGINPDNIYLTHAGNVKLIGFSAARNALHQRSSSLPASLKDGYAPVEMYRASGTQGTWTDVYSMAATLYRAITGKTPQPALDRQAHDGLSWPSQLQIEIEPRVEAALMKALAVEVSGRFPSMEDFKGALSGQPAAFVTPAMPLAVTPVPPAPPVKAADQPPPSSPPPSPRSPLRWLWLIIPVAAILIGAMVMLVIVLPKFLHRSVPKPPPVPVVSEHAPILENPTEQNPPSHPDDAKPPANPEIAASQTQPQAEDSSAPSNGSPAAPAAAAAPMAGPAYETLIHQGADYAATGDPNSAANVYKQAMQLEQDNPKAYAALGELYLYTIGNLPEALKYYHAAIAHGGVVTFHVRHDRGGGDFAGEHDGRLQLSNTSVSYVSDKTGVSFDVPRSGVKEAKPDKVLGFLTRRHLNVFAFHLRLEDGKNYNFAPGSNFKESERDLILNIITKGNY